MTRRPVLIVILVAGAVIATASVLARDGNGDGPLDSGIGSGYGQDMEVGQSATMGHVWLFNHGNKPAVLERVRILDAPSGMELIGVHTKLFPAAGKEPTLGSLGYPIEAYPTRSFAEGNVVPVVKERTPGGTPDGFLQLLIGVRTTKLGVVHSRAVEITYRVGGAPVQGGTPPPDRDVHATGAARPVVPEQRCPGPIRRPSADLPAPEGLTGHHQVALETRDLHRFHASLGPADSGTWAKCTSQVQIPQNPEWPSPGRVRCLSRRGGDRAGSYG